MKPFISGVLSDWTDRGRGNGGGRHPLPGVKVEVRTDDEKKEVITDCDGHFSFDNLSHKTYGVNFDLPGWRFIVGTETIRSVDLTQSFCAELFLPVEELPGPPNFY